MARIEWVKHRLENWGRWSMQQEAGALGFPRQSTFVRLAPSAGRNESSVPISDLDAAEIDDAVMSLKTKKYKSHLYLVLTLTYAKGLPRHLVAKKMCKAESTVNANLGDADREIERWLSDKREAQQKKLANSGA